MPITTPRAALAALRAHGTAKAARELARGGEAAATRAGAAAVRFLGVRAPQVRAVLRQCELPLPACVELLASRYHEARQLALLAMVRLAARADDATRRRVCAAYLRNAERIDTGALVDCSAEHLVGPVLRGPDLARLARSSSVWERRIAVVATLHGVKRGAPGDALRVARVLRRDPDTAIQAVVGAALREVGRRCDRAVLRDFLSIHGAALPRAVVRVAVARLDPADRRRWLTAASTPAVPGRVGRARPARRRAGPAAG